MTMEVKNAFHDSLEGGSSLFNVDFNMDFASDGLSWVKGICQAFETSCNGCVNACNKYVNTAGEHIKRLYDEVCQWEIPSDDRWPISGSDIKHDTTANVSIESLADLEKDCLSEKPSDCDQKQPNVSIPEDSDIIVLSNESQSQSHVIACDGDNDEPHSTGGIYCLDDLGEDCKETSNTFRSPADSTSLSVQDCKQLPDSHRGREPSTILVDRTSEANGSSQDAMGSCGNENGKQIGSYKMETSGLCLENDVMEVSVGREEVTSRTAKMPDPSLETEEFEAIKVEDFCDNAKKDEVALISHCGDKSKLLEAIKLEAFWEDAEKDEVALISHLGDKNTSLKKKLRSVFGSRKGYSRATNYHYELNSIEIQNGMEKERMSSTSSHLRVSSSGQESIESGWELL